MSVEPCPAGQNRSCFDTAIASNFLTGRGCGLARYGRNPKTINRKRNKFCHCAPTAGAVVVDWAAPDGAPARGFFGATGFCVVAVGLLGQGGHAGRGRAAGSADGLDVRSGLLFIVRSWRRFYVWSSVSVTACPPVQSATKKCAVRAGWPRLQRGASGIGDGPAADRSSHSIVGRRPA